MRTANPHRLTPGIVLEIVGAVVLAGILLSLPFLGCGGGRGYFSTDTTLSGIKVDLGEQPEDGLEDYLSRCLQVVPQDTSRARLKYLPDHTSTTKDCATKELVAGCYRVDLDLMLVTQGYPLESTATCHELTHRYLWLAKGRLDTDHQDNIWSIVR